jgi:alanine racemase
LFTLYDDEEQEDSAIADSLDSPGSPYQAADRAQDSVHADAGPTDDYSYAFEAPVQPVQPAQLAQLAQPEPAELAEQSEPLASAPYESEHFYSYDPDRSAALDPLAGRETTEVFSYRPNYVSVPELGLDAEVEAELSFSSSPAFLASSAYGEDLRAPTEQVVSPDPAYRDYSALGLDAVPTVEPDPAYELEYVYDNTHAYSEVPQTSPVVSPDQKTVTLDQAHGQANEQDYDLAHGQAHGQDYSQAYEQYVGQHDELVFSQTYTHPDDHASAQLYEPTHASSPDPVSYDYTLDQATSEHAPLPVEQVAAPSAPAPRPAPARNSSTEGLPAVSFSGHVLSEHSVFGAPSSDPYSSRAASAFEPYTSYSAPAHDPYAPAPAPAPDPYMPAPAPDPYAPAPVLEPLEQDADVTFEDLAVPERRWAWVEVDLDAIRQNAKMVRRHIGPDIAIMAIVKDNGYGHGAVEVAKAAMSGGAKHLGVSTVKEGIELRRAGLTDVPILVLSEPPAETIPLLLRHKLTATVYTSSFALALGEAASAKGTAAPYHLKVDTGMSRLGVHHTDAGDFLRAIDFHDGLELKGVFTHFATADASDTFGVRTQVDRFEYALDTIRYMGIKPGIVHAANSAALIRFRETHYNMVRLGIALYGLHPGDTTRSLITLKPAMSVRARVMYVKPVAVGEGISYGFTYQSPGSVQVATIPIGYGDGLSRVLSNRMDVLVGGRAYPQVGTICMDMCMFEINKRSSLMVPSQDLQIGDEVVIIGRSGALEITLDDMARVLGTINYDLACRFGLRLERKYVDLQ